MKRVLVADEMQRMNDLVRALMLGAAEDVRVVGMASSAQMLAEQIRELEPDVVLLARELPGADGLQLAEQLARKHGHTWFFLMVDASEPQEVWKTARNRGIRDVLMLPVTAEAVVQAIKRVEIEEAERARARDRTAAGAVDDGVRLAAEDAVRLGTLKQRVICIYSPKGGVGKTALAVNLALAYQLNPTVRLRVALVDLDLSLGDVATVLDLKPNVATVLDWIEPLNEAGGPLNAEGVADLVTLTPEGLAVVAGPHLPGDDMELGRDGREHERVRWLLESLRREYDVVIIDTGPQLRDATLVALEDAHRTFFVATLDVQCLRGIYRTVERLREAGLDVSRFRLVVNRMGRKSDMSLRDVQEIAAEASLPLVAKIPEDPKMQLAINQGKPLLLDGGGPFVEAVRALAHQEIPVFGRPRGRLAIRGSQDGPKPNTGLFSKIFRRPVA